MANYESLKSAIQSVIAENGNNEITGNILQQTLLTIINSVGSGYQFIGIATPETTPGTPDQRVFYIGSSGTYPNFGPAIVPSGSLGIFYYDSSWHFGTVAFPIGEGTITTSMISDEAVTKNKLASALVSLFESGYVYLGVATLQTTPGTPERNGFYLTTGVGVYPNFGGLAVTPGEMAIFKYSNNAWSKDSVSILDAIIYGGTGQIVESDNPKISVILYAGSTTWEDSPGPSVMAELIPLQTGTTYTLTFANGLGSYAVVTDSVAVAGQSAHIVSPCENTTQGQVVTIQGLTGQYLYVRADPVSNGRVFPVIRTETAGSPVLLRSEVGNVPVENGTGVVSSGGLYAIFQRINDILEQINGVLPVGYSEPPGRQNVPVSDIALYNRVPGGASNNTRVLSSTIPIPTGATGFHISLSSGYLAVIYYLRENGTWDENVQSSGSFAQNASIGAPNYNSAGIWLYFRKDDSSATITVAEVQAAITEMYFDVPDSFFLPVASKELAQKSISILFIGNSLTQDAISYVPFLLRNLYPNVSFKFYMWYNGGYTLAQQYTKFTNNQTCEIFSVCENTTGWINYNNVITMRDILAVYKFDIVCLQEYFNYKTTYTDADLADFNNCLDYIRNNYSQNFKVVTLFHAPLRSSADSVFALTKSGNELILQKTIAESIMAPGVAIYRALSTSLDSLGDSGHLSPDGTHAQEGLPCLLEAFVVFLWIMRQLAIPVSIANCQLKMTTDIYNTINVPGPNIGTGVIPGTDAENKMAQDVAILADKEGRGILFESFIAIGQ